MTISASHAILLAGISLLSGSYVLADEPDSATLSVMVLPAQRTPVYVWPILRGCTPDKLATAAVVRKLNADPRLEVHQLSLPADPRVLGCSGASCAEFLSGPGCQPRSGILVGGELDEAPCDASDQSLLGCTGQLLTRVRVFRVDLEQNQPTRGDYRYALCQEGRCGASTVEESAAQLLEQLVGTQSLPAPPAALRASPEPEEQCNGRLKTALAPAPEPQTPPLDLTGKAVAYAYYTQYKHLSAAGSPGPSKEQAEQEAQTRATHFTEGATLPAGPQYVPTPVNTKYALLPGEELYGNVRRVSTLQGLLSTPPPGPAYDSFRKTPTAQRRLIILVLDHESKSLGIFLGEPSQALRAIAPPSACQAGGGESATCVAAAVQAALTPADARLANVVPLAPTPTAGPQRPLGCIPFRARSCPACYTPPAVAAAPVPAAPVLPPLEPTQPSKWTTRFLYAAMGVAVLTAGALTIADSVTSPIVLTDSEGNSASITGLLRPAQWTAWGLTLALAVPTAISVIEGNKPRPREPLPLTPVPAPSGPRCPISDER